MYTHVIDHSSRQSQYWSRKTQTQRRSPDPPPLLFSSRSFSVILIISVALPTIKTENHNLKIPLYLITESVIAAYTVPLIMVVAFVALSNINNNHSSSGKVWVCRVDNFRH